MGQLDDKIAVVTGATSGSGLAIATRFVEEGATVAMLARGAERLRETAASLGERAIPIPTELGDPDSVRAAFSQVEERFGKLDVLINNAAIYRPCPVERLTDDDIARQLATNLAGPFYTSRAAIPLMRAAGAGDIINTSSESTIDPYPLLSLYVSTKAGLEALSLTLAQEVREDVIRVTSLVQGTAFGPGGGSTGWEWDPVESEEATKKWTELGLLNRSMGSKGGQTVEDVADVHIFIVTRPRTQRLDTVWCRSF